MVQLISERIKQIEHLNDCLAKGFIPTPYEYLTSRKPLWLLPKVHANTIKELILKHKPKNILELGTGSGYATLHMYETAKEYGGKVSTIEFDEKKIRLAKYHFKDLPIKLIEGRVKDIIKDWQEQIDFLLIDANKHESLSYLITLWPLLTDDCIIVADDCDKQTMSSYVDYVKKKCEIIKNEDLLICKKS